MEVAVEEAVVAAAISQQAMPHLLDEAVGEEGATDDDLRHDL